MFVYAIQLDISWENPQASILSATAMAAMANVRPGSLVILPETFATGFTLNAAVLAAAEAQTTRALCDLARSLEAWVCGGLAVKGSAGRLENQALLVDPQGREAVRYAKRHSFTPLKEQTIYAAGRDIFVHRVGDLAVTPVVCYDLRFPEDFRQAVRQGAEAFVVIADWPVQRQEHWRALLIARAIENQAFVVGVNRCGRDPDHEYVGGSLIVGPRGQVLAEAGAGPQVLSAELDVRDLRAWREEFPALKDML